MRADHAVRHNAAVGAVLGLAVGDAIGHCEEVPPTVTGESLHIPAWGSMAAGSFARAEALISGEPIDMGVSASEVVASAIRLSDPDATPPLLGDPSTVLVCQCVRLAMVGELAIEAVEPSCDDTTIALDAVTAASSFSSALTSVHSTASASPAALPITGAIAGMVWGPSSIPAAWVTTVHGSVGDRTYGLRQLRRLAERLMQFDAPVPPEPRRSLGPREVAPRLWLSNLHAVPRFIAAHPDAAVISLCPTTGAFDSHDLRREFAIHDASGRRVNPLLGSVLDEVLATIDAFHAADRDVLVHCHHGASRTGLVLRAWLMRHLHLDFDDATTEAQVRWPKTSTWNQAFNVELKKIALRQGLS